MDDLDRSLALLTKAPMPISLDSLEDEVMARFRMASHAVGPSFRLSVACAAVCALMLGVGADEIASRRGTQPSGIAGLSAPAPYALSAIVRA